MTRLNVYAGPAGFFIVRGGPAGDAAVVDSRNGRAATLPGPAPKEGDKFPPNKAYKEIPIAIQDRSFNADGSLFYPDTRAFFDGVENPYMPDTDLSPIWNPEFFGNTIIVNGNTWPFHTVEKCRYRFRVLNGCQSRFLILDFNKIPGVEVWAIGNEGGFLAAPVNLTADNGNRLLMGLAERADLIVDFSKVPVGNYVLGNVGPDEPFGGGIPGVDFDSADPESTGQIMEFRVVPAVGVDTSTPPKFLELPPIAALPPETVTRRLAMLEMMSSDFDGPAQAMLGTVAGNPNVAPGVWTTHEWMHPLTENPEGGAVEVWELYNTTEDAHPMHIHNIAFEVVDRQDIIVDESIQTVQVVAGVDPDPGRTVGDRGQGHGHRLPRPGHPGQNKVQHTGTVRLALPHRRTRRQRNDAPLPRRTTAGRSTRLENRRRLSRFVVRSDRRRRAASRAKPGTRSGSRPVPSTDRRATTPGRGRADR